MKLEASPVSPAVVPEGRRAWWSIALMALATVGMALPLARSWPGYRVGSPGTNDLIAYWSAGRLLLDGDDPYDLASLDRVERSQGWAEPVTVAVWNPPWLLVWLVPLAELPFHPAAMTWLAVSLALILACATVTWRELAGPEAGKTVPIAWGATAAFVPVLFLLHMGQVSTLLVLGLAGFAWAAPRGRDALAGAFLALTTIKPHVVHLVWVVALYWMVAGKRWRFAAGVAAVLGPSVVALAAFWPRALIGYRAVLEHPPLHYMPPTLAAVLRLLVDPANARIQVVVPMVIALAALAWLIVRQPAIDWRTWLGPVLLVSVPTAAYGWCFDQTVLLIPYLAIVAWLVRPASGSLARKTLVAAILAATAAGMVAVNKAKCYDVAFAWSPPALGLAYAIARPGSGAIGWGRRRWRSDGASSAARGSAVGA
jgi:hypothetical protein